MIIVTAKATDGTVSQEASFENYVTEDQLVRVTEEMGEAYPTNDIDVSYT